MAKMVILDDMNTTEVREAIANGDFISDKIYQEDNAGCFNCMGYAFGCYAWINLVFIMITLYMMIGWAIIVMLCICHSKRDIQMYFRKHKK